MIDWLLGYVCFIKTNQVYLPSCSRGTLNIHGTTTRECYAPGTEHDTSPHHSVTARAGLSSCYPLARISAKLESETTHFNG